MYELTYYTVEMKTALGDDGSFRTEKTVNAMITEAELTGLKADTAYLVRVVSHRMKSQKEGLSNTLEITTKGRRQRFLQNLNTHALICGSQNDCLA